jgi:hypothetical protein
MHIQAVNLYKSILSNNIIYEHDILYYIPRMWFHHRDYWQEEVLIVFNDEYNEYFYKDHKRIIFEISTNTEEDFKRIAANNLMIDVKDFSPHLIPNYSIIDTKLFLKTLKHMVFS